MLRLQRDELQAAHVQLGLSLEERLRRRPQVDRPGAQDLVGDDAHGAPLYCALGDGEVSFIEEQIPGP